MENMSGWFSERECGILEGLLMDAMIDKRTLTDSDASWNFTLAALIEKVWHLSEFWHLSE